MIYSWAKELKTAQHTTDKMQQMNQRNHNVLPKPTASDGELKNVEKRINVVENRNNEFPKLYLIQRPGKLELKKAKMQRKRRCMG